MNVLAISGSPRREGNTEILVRSALIPFKEKEWDVREFLLSEKTINPCMGCETCQNTGECRIKNDDMGSLYDSYAWCDALIIGSPVYYRNVTAQLKALFDRTHAVDQHKLLLGKAGGAIAVGRGEGGGQSLVLSIIHNFYLSSGAICVPGEINGLSARADQPGDILRQERRLEQARFLGENLIKYAEMMRRPLEGSH